jgi:dethiobiotin synthetase
VQGFFVTGTDTDVGKTVVAAWLVARLGACYWKPVQAGAEPETDSQIVRRLSGASPDRILPEAYVLAEPIAPHEAARRAGIAIDMAKLDPPPCDGPLVVEGAGGLMVPLDDQSFVIDLARELELPLILVARSTLGTINHTLLSLEAIRRRGLPLAGVVVNGPETPHNRAAIERYGKVEVIAEIPWLEQVTPATLMEIEPELDLTRLANASAA